MAREDLLANLLLQLTQKESPPPQDDNTLIQKMIAPNDSAQLSDGAPTFTKLIPANFKWGGTGHTAGWLWNQGQWKGTKASFLQTTQSDWVSGVVNNLATASGLQLTSKGVPSFARNSVAYNSDGSQVAVNVPRYQAGKFGQAVLIEEETTNLLTANQSHPTNGTTGWGLGNSSGCTAILSQVASTSWIGGGSLQAVISGFTSGDLFVVTTTEPTSIPVSASTSYAFSSRVRAPSGGTYFLRVIQWNSSGGIVSDTAASTVTGNGAWQTQSYTFTTASTTAYVSLRIELQANGTWNFDGIQLEQKSYVTSWITGGSTRSVDSLTVPTTNVLNDSGFTVECWVNRDDSNISNIHVIWKGYADANDQYILRALGPNGFLDLTVIANGTNYEFTSTSVLNSGAWNNVAATFDGSIAKLYLNGTLLGSVSYVKPATPTMQHIGANEALGAGFNGLIDDLRISSIARSAFDIQNAYNSGAALPIDQYSTYKLNFDSNLLAGAGGQQISALIIDLGPAPKNNLTIASADTVPANTTETLQIRFSSDGQSWGSWQTVTKGQVITSGISRFCQSQIILQTNDVSVTPVVKTLELDVQYAV